LTHGEFVAERKQPGGKSDPLIASRARGATCRDHLLAVERASRALPHEF
jgi:hypothetical protein